MGLYKLGAGTIDLPDSKVGTRPIYLNQPARDILSEITKQTDNPYVCCGAVPGRPIVNIQKSWRRIRTLAAIEDVRLNDLRHTFASVAVSNGVSLHIVGGLLGHTQPRTTARYAHLAADPLIEAAERLKLSLRAPGNRPLDLPLRKLSMHVTGHNLTDK